MCFSTLTSSDRGAMILNRDGGLERFLAEYPSLRGQSTAREAPRLCLVVGPHTGQLQTIR